MKITSLIFVVILSLIAVSEIRGQRQSANNDDIKIDVTKKSLPQKKLILQDFMDIEYIVLETKNDFINQGIVLDIGKKIMLVKNGSRINDGNIFVYDRTGKALRTINRKGQGGEEYISVFSIALDEENGEIFVNDILGGEIVVYDLHGNFKRNLKHKKGTNHQFYIDVFNYDRHHLICYDENNKESLFALISKRDGSIAKKIKIPFKEKKFLQQTKKYDNDSQMATVGPGPYNSIIPFNGNWLLLEVSSDTVYTFLPDYSLRPFIVRTPSVQSMDPEVMLVLRLLSDRYYFMEAIKNEYDWNTSSGFPQDYFMYDKLEKKKWGYTVYNGDYSTKKEIYMSNLKPINHEIGSWQALQAHELVESYKKGELKGRLKEIAATLDEDSNPVIMLIKHKK